MIGRIDRMAVANDRRIDTGMSGIDAQMLMVQKYKNLVELVQHRLQSSEQERAFFYGLISSADHGHSKWV